MTNHVWRRGAIALAVATLVATLGLAQPAAAAHVTPITVAGNPTCLSLTTDTLYELKVDPPVSGETYTDGVLEVTITLHSTSAGQTLDWVANIGVDSVVVKGGPAANHYIYTPEAISDTGLHAPANRSGKWAAVSHVSFCYDIDDVFAGCTHGYWKVSQHFDSWVPTGYSPNQTLGSVFIGAPNPSDSLLDAMNYGGGPTLDDKKRLLLVQAVAALLNAAHPDVDYPYTTAAVIAATNAVLASNLEAAITSLQGSFDAANNNGCPLN